ncbi:MAG: recombinase family protein [Pseudomonadota bacterium]
MTYQKTHTSEWTALICCRVSDKSQLKGSGLDSQEYRCRRHAELNRYPVEAVFLESKSGGLALTERPAIRDLIAHIDDNKASSKSYVVIFDDHKRFARETRSHLDLRDMLAARDVRVEFLNFTPEDSPEGKFSETVFAAQAQLEREQNARQTRQKSKARIEQGYCITAAPVGYRYIDGAGGGRELVPDEPQASIVREALEGFASGRFASQVEVKRFLEGQPEFPKGDAPSGEVRQQRVMKILRNYLYAGYVAAPYWGVSLRKGKHEGLISFETYQAIQAKLDGRVYAPWRKDVREDFPLRGAVDCACCGTPLTAGWSKGKRKKYPYYFCRRKGCDAYGKTIPRSKIEDDFAGVIETLRPTRGLFEIGALMFRDAWDQRTAQAASVAKGFAREAEKIEQEVEALVERVTHAKTPRVIAAYETRIEDLENQKLVAAEKALGKPESRGTFDDLFEHALRFLADPCKIWKTGRFDLQRLVLKLTFSEHLQYCRETGFRTPQTSLPFKHLGGNFMLKNQMVPPG